MTSTETKPESTENLEPIVFLEEEEDFNQLYEESLIGIKEQDIVHAKVSEVGKDFVIIDFGYKSDCRIPLEEFQNFEGEIDVQAGDRKREVWGAGQGLPLNGGMILASGKKIKYFRC